ANIPMERERVEAEIDHVLASGLEPVRWLDQMPLTRASFEEALRLYPPAPSINREAIEDDRFGDQPIKRGTQVLVMPWTVQRHRKLWDDPEAFKPSRFYPENREKIGRFQYLPFGAGPRVCIGASFAMQEAVIALAVLMSRYRFDLVPETKPWPVQKLTTQPEGGLPMRVTRRSAAKLSACEVVLHMDRPATRHDCYEVVAQAELCIVRLARQPQRCSPMNAPLRIIRHGVHRFCKRAARLDFDDRDHVAAPRDE